MLNLTYSYRIYPGLEQEAQMLGWLEQCRCVYNYALAERKDWINSRKCPVNACSIRQEYIIPADTPYPDYYKQQNALTKAKEAIPELKAVVDPNGTSQTCPQCGAHTGKKELSERVHQCSECGYTTVRDVAAAQVVVQRGLVAVGQTAILPVEEGCSGTPMKQETSRAILGSPRSTRFG